jgi:hypothetical protein
MSTEGENQKSSEKVQQAFSDDSDSEDYDEDDEDFQCWTWQYAWQNEDADRTGWSSETYDVTDPSCLDPEKTFTDFSGSIFEGR